MLEVDGVLEVDGRRPGYLLVLKGVLLPRQVQLRVVVEVQVLKGLSLKQILQASRQQQSSASSLQMLTPQRWLRILTPAAWRSRRFTTLLTRS